MRTSMRFAILAIVALLFTRSLHAQTATPSDPSGSVGVFFQQMAPRGDFRENTRGAERSHQAAFGFNLIGHVNSVVALRLEYFFGMYYKNPVAAIATATYSGRLVLAASSCCRAVRCART